ncbi:MAG TPA: hypothetical protein VHI78_11755 [Bacteroidales bacterium]|jgi:hypothetical protein|nr:hypothetical protein [Bacteroidales bacterium]
MKNFVIGLVSMFIVITGCNEPDEVDFFREISYNFNNNIQGWQVMFSDYPVGEEEFYELESGFVKLPLPLDTTLNAVMISGNNHSDDLFSYMYVPLTGLAPHTTYQATFIVHLASNVATNSVGIGGSPDLTVGVGALDTVPANIIDESNYYRPNFEVRLQSGESNNIMQAVGTLGVTDTTTVYTPITRNNLSQPMPVTSNGDGMLYLLVGWDSGFEGITKIYIKTVIVRLELVSK